MEMAPCGVLSLDENSEAKRLSAYKGLKEEEEELLKKEDLYGFKMTYLVLKPLYSYSKSYFFTTVELHNKPIP